MKCDVPVNGIDCYPTFLEMTQTAKAAGKTLDGLSMIPLLTPYSRISERPLFWLWDPFTAL